MNKCWLVSEFCTVLSNQTYMCISHISTLLEHTYLKVAHPHTYLGDANKHIEDLLSVWFLGRSPVPSLWSPHATLYALKLFIHATHIHMRSLAL